MTASEIRRVASISCHLSLSFPAHSEGSLSLTRSRPVLSCRAHSAESADKDVTGVLSVIMKDVGCNQMRQIHLNPGIRLESSCVPPPSQESSTGRSDQKLVGT